MKGLCAVVVLVAVMCLSVMPALAQGAGDSDRESPVAGLTAPDQADQQAAGDKTAKEEKDGKGDAKLAPVLLAGAAVAAAAGGSGGGGSAGKKTVTPDAVTPPEQPQSRVPEPATLALVGLGVAGLGAYARRRMRRS